jgi:hypothetical protein
VNNLRDTNDTQEVLQNTNPIIDPQLIASVAETDFDCGENRRASVTEAQWSADGTCVIVADRNKRLTTYLL